MHDDYSRYRDQGTKCTFPPGPAQTNMHASRDQHARTYACIHALRTVKKKRSVALHVVCSSMHCLIDCCVDK
jgi:hypothetical protein